MYIGRATELRLFGNAPAVIDVPFGALYGDMQNNGAAFGPLKASDVPSSQSALGIAHELGHIICDRLPDLIPDIEGQVRIGLNRIRSTRQQRTIQDAVLPWLEEIVADMFGTALDDLSFARGALKRTNSPVDLLDRGDRTHPIMVIRPYVHLATLSYLAQQIPNYRVTQDDITRLAKDIDTVARGRLDRRFEFASAVTAVPLKAVMEEMLKVVGEIFLAKPGVFREQKMTIGDLLVACANAVPDPDACTLPTWGDDLDQDEERAQPVLDATSLEFADSSPFCSLCHLVGLTCDGCS